MEFKAFTVALCYTLLTTTTTLSVSAQSVTAKVVLIRNSVLAGEATTGYDDPIIGTLEFEQFDGHENVGLTGTVKGLTPGRHGFHIHDLGNIAGGCKSAGGHFNPENKTHGDISSPVRHVGDLGNIVADFNGESDVSIMDNKIQLKGPHSIIGRAVVVHAGEDDLGLGGNAESLKTGNAGGRVACGIVGIATSGYNPVTSNVANSGIWNTQRVRPNIYDTQPAVQPAHPEYDSRLDEAVGQQQPYAIALDRPELANAQECRDEAECGHLVDWGYCSLKVYENYMTQQCKKSCNFCHNQSDIIKF